MPESSLTSPIDNQDLRTLPMKFVIMHPSLHPSRNLLCPSDHHFSPDAYGDLQSWSLPATLHSFLHSLDLFFK